MSQELFAAIAAGDRPAIERQLGADATLAGSRNAQGLSAVMVATYHRKSDIADRLIAAGAPLDLFEAAATGRADRVRALLRDDPSRVNAYAPDGFFPLALATFFGHEETVRVLLDAGADIHQVSREAMKVAPIQSAAAAGQPAIARLLIERGADVNRVYPENGLTPLHEAAANGDLEMARVLIAGGAALSPRAADGRTPLALAIEKGRGGMEAFLRGCGTV